MLFSFLFTVVFVVLLVPLLLPDCPHLCLVNLVVSCVVAHLCF